MDEKGSGKKAVILMRFVLFLLLLVIGLSCRYMLRNREQQEEIRFLSEEPADRDRTVEAGARKKECLQDGYSNVYLIDRETQLRSLQQMRVDVTEINYVVNVPGECEELELYLADFSECPVRVELYAWDSDIREITDALRERWERNQEKEGYYVSLSYYPYFGEKADEESYTQNILTPFYILAGNDYKEIIEGALKQEEGYLRFVRLERIGEITCCSFEIGEMEESYHREGDGYHIILEGKWDGEEIQRQHLCIPYTKLEQYSVGTYQDYGLEEADINFDGKQDLLIHEGGSGGSGGSWENYRAIVWNGETGQFEYYPSFPERANVLDFDRQRVIFRGSGGAFYEHVMVYGVVDGEYVCTRELETESRYSEEKQDYIDVLSYYEMGELKQTYILSDMEEREQLYPDMNYWR